MDALSADELLVHPVVIAAFEAAWADSFADDDGLRHEEGGWIYQNAATGEVVIRRSLPGSFNKIDLRRPPVLTDHHVVATYHTHPNPTSQGWNPEPSDDDQHNGVVTGVPWFVISDSGVYVTGPTARVGGLDGDPDFPMP